MARPRKRLARSRVLIVAALVAGLTFGAAPPPAPSDRIRVPGIDFSNPLSAIGSALAAGPRLLFEGLRAVGGWLAGSPAQAAESQPVEIVSLRSRDAKTFQNPDGTRTALFGHLLHYEAAPGDWRDVDLSFRPEGEDWVADRNAVIVRVGANAITATDRGSGKGVRFPLPAAPTVSGRTASFAGPGFTWTYATTKAGLKLSATVPRRLGRRTYTFGYQTTGGAAPLAEDQTGGLVSDAFRIPRAVVYGADGEAYELGAWRIPAPGQAAFDFDDTDLPAAAFPYELDPTTTFSVAAGADDGFVRRSGDTYRPTRARP